MNTAPPAADPAEKRPLSADGAIETTDAPKLQFEDNLYDFLDGVAEGYEEQGDSSHAERVRQARSELGSLDTCAAGLGEVYLFSRMWEKYIIEQKDVSPSDELQYYQARQTFLDNCAITYPYIDEIPRESLGPDASTELGRVNRAMDDIAKRMESKPTSIDVMEIYRLQMLKNQLEREVHQTPPGAGQVEPMPIPSPAPAREFSPEELKVQAGENWKRLGMDQNMGVTLDQWLQQDLNGDPHPDLFGPIENNENIQRWRNFDTALREVRYWYQQLKPEEKGQNQQELIRRINEVLEVA